MGWTSLWVIASLLTVHRVAWTTIAADQWRVYHWFLEQGFPLVMLDLQNGHRLVFPGFFFLADLFFFGARNHLLNVVGPAFCAMTAALLTLSVWQDRELSRAARVVIGCCPWLGLFWLGNVRVLGHGNESVHAYLVTSMLALSVYAFHRLTRTERESRGLWLLTACLACFVATFSFGTGLATWCALIVLALMCRRFRGAAVAFVASLLLICALYFVVLPGGSQSYGYMSFEPVSWLLNISTWLGSPLFHTLVGWGVTQARSLSLAFLAGALGFVFVVAVVARYLWRDPPCRRPAELVGIALGSFGLVAALIVNLARVTYYADLPEQIVAPRYLVWTTLFWTGISILIASWILRRRQDRPTLAAVSLSILVLPMILSLPAQRQLVNQHGVRRSRIEGVALGIALGVWDEPAILRFLAPAPYMVRDFGAWLNERQSGMYGELLPQRIGEAFADHYRNSPRGPRGRITVLRPLAEGGSTSGAQFRGTTEEESLDHVVVVDDQGSIRGFGLELRSPAGADTSENKESKDRTHFSGYVADYSEGKAYEFFAVLDEGVSAVPLRLAPGLVTRPKPPKPRPKAFDQ